MRSSKLEFISGRIWEKGKKLVVGVHINKTVHINTESVYYIWYFLLAWKSISFYYHLNKVSYSSVNLFMQWWCKTVKNEGHRWWENKKTELLYFEMFLVLKNLFNIYTLPRLRSWIISSVFRWGISNLNVNALWICICNSVSHVLQPY